MPNYRRAFIPGGTWFFTVNLLQRRGNDLLVREIDLLRRTVRRVRKNYPFHIDAWVALPEHLHCVLTLPPGDSQVGWARCLCPRELQRAMAFDYTRVFSCITQNRTPVCRAHGCG